MALSCVFVQFSLLEANLVVTGYDRVAVHQSTVIVIELLHLKCF